MSPNWCYQFTSLAAPLGFSVVSCLNSRLKNIMTVVDNIFMVLHLSISN